MARIPVTDKATDENRHKRSGERVEHTAELDELVAFVTATTEGVEHGVDHRVEHTHAETGDKGADEVNPETANTVPAGHVLEEDAHKADDDGEKGGVLVTDFLQKQSRRNTHHGISDEVGRIA